ILRSSLLALPNNFHPISSLPRIKNGCFARIIIESHRASVLHLVVRKSFPLYYSVNNESQIEWHHVAPLWQFLNSKQEYVTTKDRKSTRLNSSHVSIS